MTSKFQEYLRARQASAMPAEAPAAAAALDRPLRVTFFANKFASGKTQETVSLRGLVERIKTTQAKTKDALPWLKLATFGDVRHEPKTQGAQGSLRHDANVLQIDGVEADYDGEKITVERARTILAGAGVAAILYTSPSHTEDTPRWRVLCPTSAALPPTQRAALVARLNGLFVGALAGESFTLSQSYFYGKLSGNSSHEVVTIEGRAIDLADELDAGAIGRQKPEPVARPVQSQPSNRAPLTDGGTAYGIAALDGECEAILTAPDGNKHHTVNKAAYAIGGLVTAGELQEGSAFAELSAALDTILPYCKDKRAAQNTLRTAFRDGMSKAREVPDLAPVSDLTPAEREQIAERCGPMLEKLAQRHSDVVRKHAEKTSKPLPVGTGLMDVEGALKLFVDHCDATAFSRQPFLALGAGICAIGALAGRRYRTRTDLRSNIYGIGLADSGGGKDHARGVIKKTFFNANLGDYLGGNKIASGSGLLSALARHPSMLFQLDEIGLWLQGVLGKNASSHQKEIWANLMELYSSANMPFGGTEYANQKENQRVILHQPNASVWGTSVPIEFWKAMESGALQNGSLARFLVFLSPCNYPDTPLPTAQRPPDALLEAFQAIAAGVPGHDYGGNLAATMAAGVDIEPYTVPETPAAYDALMQLKADELAWKRKAEGTYATAQIARMFENAYKLALIRAEVPLRCAMV